MPDYKALYFALFRETERARRLLEQAQQAAEADYLAQAAPPVRLAPPAFVPGDCSAPDAKAAHFAAPGPGADTDAPAGRPVQPPRQAAPDAASSRAPR